MSEILNKSELLNKARELSEKHSELKSLILGIIEQTEKSVSEILKEMNNIESEYLDTIKKIKEE